MILSPSEPPAVTARSSSFEIPSALRALVRARESSILFLGAAIGALAGLTVAAMSGIVALMHSALFEIPLGQRLSATPVLDPCRAFVFPLAGGMIFGLVL